MGAKPNLYEAGDMTFLTDILYHRGCVNNMLSHGRTERIVNHIEYLERLVQRVEPLADNDTTSEIESETRMFNFGHELYDTSLTRLDNIIDGCRSNALTELDSYVDGTTTSSNMIAIMGVIGQLDTIRSDIEYISSIYMCLLLNSD